MDGGTDWEERARQDCGWEELVHFTERKAVNCTAGVIRNSYIIIHYDPTLYSVVTSIPPLSGTAASLTNSSSLPSCNPLLELSGMLRRSAETVVIPLCSFGKESSYARLLDVPERDLEPKKSVRRTGRQEAITAMAVSIMETVQVISCWFLEE